MKEEKREIRSYSGLGVPHLREAREGEPGTGRTIEGYAVVFGSESILLVDWCEAYREIIEPGAVTEEDLKGWDIKMTMWHNREKLLARSNKGTGSLRLSVDERGVRYEFETPDTADGNNALELVRRGDLSGSSFTFSTTPDAVRYEEREDGTLLRHVDRIGRVYEMTLASDPAYSETSVTAREAGVVDDPSVRHAEGKGAEAIAEVRRFVERSF